MPHPEQPETRAPVHPDAPGTGTCTGLRGGVREYPGALTPDADEETLEPDLAEPPREADGIALRRPDLARTNFDEIVTPHPVVAFLFRRRTFIVLLGMLAMVPFANPNPIWLGIGIALAVLAEVLRIWAAGTIHKTEELTTGGPYAYLRHPLYVGSFAHTIAFCFMSGHWQSFLIALPLFLLLYSAAVSTEEAMLLKLFGARYAEYSRRVPRFLPHLRRPECGYGEFSWSQVIENKEYVNIIWAVVLCGLFILRAR